MRSTVEMPVRQFVPQQIDPSDWSQIAPLGRLLLDRPINSATELEKWLLDVSELCSVIDEYGTRRYIDKSCHTEDKAIEQRFLHYIENIEPPFKKLSFEFQKKYLSCPHRAQLADVRYQVLTRQWQADVDIFRAENVELETEVTRLVTEYDKVCGAMMVNFRGRDYTMQQMARFLEEPDRTTRKDAWEAMARRRWKDRQTIEQLFDRVLPLREKIARNAGFADYRAYAWMALKRFDYSPEDCVEFAQSIARTCVPLMHELDRQRAGDMKLERLRPWDLAVDPKNRPPLRPFAESDIDGFIMKTRSIFERLSPELAADFDVLRRRNNLDLGSRRGKQPGGYQSTLNEVREPFIFMNAAGLHRDLETMLHEGGHAFHALAARDEPLMFLRHGPMEFNEVASMAMELFGNEHLDVFYSEADANRARRIHLEGIIHFFPWMATIDMFQHWIYTHPGHTPQQRTAEWLRLNEQFGSRIDWSGYEDIHETTWQRQLHLFHVPFYYVEYGIAQLGALQLWRLAQRDRAAALQKYRAALRLGGTRPLPQLFEVAGIRFDFSEQTIKPMMDAISDELRKLPR